MPTSTSDYYRSALEASVRLSIDEDLDQALAVLEQALAKAREESNFVWIRILSAHAGTEAEGAGQVARARDYYELAFQSGEDSPALMYLAARVYAELGDSLAAQEWFQRSYERASETGDTPLVEKLVTLGHVDRV